MIKKTSWRPLPDFLTIKESKIEGLGVFATRNLPKGFDLGISHIFDERFPDGYIRLPLGGFINHHEIPNCNAIFSPIIDPSGWHTEVKNKTMAVHLVDFFPDSIYFKKDIKIKKNEHIKALYLKLDPKLFKQKWVGFLQKLN